MFLLREASLTRRHQQDRKEVDDEVQPRRRALAAAVATRYDLQLLYSPNLDPTSTAFATEVPLREPVGDAKRAARRRC